MANFFCVFYHEKNNLFSVIKTAYFILPNFRTGRARKTTTKRYSDTTVDAEEAHEEMEEARSMLKLFTEKVNTAEKKFKDLCKKRDRLLCALVKSTQYQKKMKAKCEESSMFDDDDDSVLLEAVESFENTN